jgi:carbamoyl-phosphate synthase large subunit
MTIKVLISGVGGDVGQGVFKALSSSKLDIEIYTTCISEHSSWLYINEKSFIAPLSADEEYIPFLIRLIKRFGIKVFFPTVDREIIKIAREKTYIENETGALVFVDDMEKVITCDDKLKTSCFLKENGFAYPYSVDADNIVAINDLISNQGFPLIVKKRNGKGSEDIFKVKNDTELNNHLNDSGFMVQEWLDPLQGEYTSGIYLGDDGEIKGLCTFRRKLKGGSTYIAERIIDSQLERPLESIARVLGMKYVNIQSMRKGNKLIPFEFNGRLSGTTAIVSKVFNAPEMFIRERLLGERLERIENKVSFVAMRYYEEIYASSKDIEALKLRSREI